MQNSIDIKQLENSFLEKGESEVVLPRREALLLKSVIETDIKIGIVKDRSGWWYWCKAKFLIASGLVRVFLLSLYSTRASRLFNFYILNRKKILNIDERGLGNNIAFTFHKKSEQRIFEQDLRRYHRAAERGDIDSQTYLGFVYLEGRGVRADLDQAREWFTKAAEQGDIKAQTHLAQIYEKGKGVPISLAAALEWYRRAADKGYALAQYNLGVMYEHGNGVEKSDAEAANWYQRAAEQNDSSSQIVLSRMYAEGRGVVKSQEKAKYWADRSKSHDSI